MSRQWEEEKPEVGTKQEQLRVGVDRVEHHRIRWKRVLGENGGDVTC